MDAAYGIGVQNRYALFLDEDEGADPFAALGKPLDASAVTGKTPPSSGPIKSPVVGKSPTPVGAGKPQQKPLSESKSNQSANQKDGRGSRTNQRGDGPRTGGGAPGTGTGTAGPRQTSAPGTGSGQENRSGGGGGFNRSPRARDNKATFDTSGEDQVITRDGKEFRGKNGFGGRGPRTGQRTGDKFGGKFGDNQRGGPGGGGGKRDFNRHSGSDKTGVKAFEKREGSGSFNWGKATDDAEADAGEHSIDAEHATGENGDKTGENHQDKTNEETAPGATEEGGPKEDEEPPTKTLDEYKREIEEKRMHTQFNIRKPGEGEDKSKWKKTYVLKKKPEVSEDEVEYEEIEVEEDANKRRHRKLLDIEINFRPSDETRRDFGGGRGDRRGPPRGDRPPRDRPPREAPAAAAGGGGEEPRSERPERRGPPRGDAGGDRPARGPRGAGGPGGARPGGFGGAARGGGRGAGGRGGFQPVTPKFDDLNDFPSL